MDFNQLFEQMLNPNNEGCSNDGTKCNNMNGLNAARLLSNLGTGCSGNSLGLLLVILLLACCGSGFGGQGSYGGLGGYGNYGNRCFDICCRRRKHHKYKRYQCYQCYDPCSYQGYGYGCGSWIWIIVLIALVACCGKKKGNCDNNVISVDTAE